LGVTREIIFRLIFLLQTILQVSAAFLIFNAIRTYWKNNTALISAALFLYLIIIKFTNGLETALFFFMIAFFIHYTISINKLWQWSVAGIIAGFCILSRLDFVFIVPALILMAVADHKTRLSIKSVVCFVTGTVIIVGPYLLYNELFFGHIIPVSGMLKSGISTSLTSVSENLKYLNKPYMLVYPMAIVYLSFYWRKRNLTNEPSELQNHFRLIVALLCLTVFMHSVHSAFFMRWGLFEWHFALYPATAILIMVEPVNLLIDKLPRLGFIFASSILIMTFGLIALRSNSYKNFPKGWTEIVYDAAIWTKNNTSDNEIFAMKDAGHFAFFSGREVINLDGLVNSFNYQEVLRDKNLNNYLIRNNTGYIVQHAFPGKKDIVSGNYKSFSFPYLSHKYNVFSDPLVLEKKDEFYRSGLYDHEGEPMVLIIWKYNHVM